MEQNQPWWSPEALYQPGERARPAEEKELWRRRRETVEEKQQEEEEAEEEEGNDAG